MAGFFFLYDMKLTSLVSLFQKSLITQQEENTGKKRRLKMLTLKKKTSSVMVFQINNVYTKWGNCPHYPQIPS